MTYLRRGEARKEHRHHLPAPLHRGRVRVLSELLHRVDVKLPSHLAHLQPWSNGGSGRRREGKSAPSKNGKWKIKLEK